LQLLAQVIAIFVNAEVKQANWPLYEPDNTAPTATFALLTTKHTEINPILLIIKIYVDFGQNYMYCPARRAASRP